MRPESLAEDLTQLAWIPPGKDGLLALTRGQWEQLRHDPAAFLLLLRIPSLSRLSPDQVNLPDLAQSPEALDIAVHHLQVEGESTLLDWSDPHRAFVYRFARACAERTHHLATISSCCDPERARLTALLAPLGWLAVAAHAPAEAAACLADPAWSAAPAEVEQQRWGLDQSEIARRLARRWSLPSWITSIVGHLGLPAEVAAQLGADITVFSIVQLAVLITQQEDASLRLPIGGKIDELLRTLGLTSLPTMPHDESHFSSSSLSLREYLATEANRRRLLALSTTARLEAELDVLHRTLEQQRERESEQLRDQKLRALAEFAAGAGHEINNPLAVISGQAQYLMGHEADSQRRKSLETIVGQTHRIHALLRDLMQFARPSMAVPRPTDLVALIDEVTTSLGELAQRHNVRVQSRDENQTVAPTPCVLSVDTGQVRTAVWNLMKNAIEAAGQDGWVRVRLNQGEKEVEIIIEDSGPGLNESQREHLFDPFYSGRQAGRGRGLGLPTAWSMARRQGGEVLLASQPGETTRFVLRLPFRLVEQNTLAG